MTAFTNAATVDLVWAQFVRAAREKGFEVIAYSFMPDHVHLVVEGLTEAANLKAFVRLAKQYSGYYYARSHGGGRLWQKGPHDRIIRNGRELLRRVRYVVNNAVAAGLVTRPEDYAFLGSQRWSVEGLVEWTRHPA